MRIAVLDVPTGIRPAASRARIAALAVLLVATTAACGGRAAPDDLPADPDTLVLRVAEYPSSPRPGGRGQVPRFSLYGGGRVVVPAGDGDAMRTAREYRLSPADYRDLLDRAYGAGLDRAGDINEQSQTDSAQLTITLATPDGARTTRVTASEAGGGDRARINAFVSSLPATPPDASAYRPSAVALLAIDGVGDAGAVRAWPLGPLSQGTSTRQGLCTVTREAVPLGRTSQDRSRWRSDDKIFAVVARPLLPDERTCLDLDR
ncbi:hypothetical protein ACTOB_003077 [Actinoplanes oblitus]|uniref:Lipoprotein n=1 Tax=Actinoplanes oblitus TaxID=3040509 RepID=A0ABY8WNI6_9ACTN|nr:hypothetical protein [Actinoplanes oblitus]WIM99426.1 hypothetical protein ACTOB_003077 [Actinoplanes oblitus]